MCLVEARCSGFLENRGQSGREEYSLVDPYERQTRLNGSGCFEPGRGAPRIFPLLTAVRNMPQHTPAALFSAVYSAHFARNDLQGNKNGHVATAGIHVGRS